MTGPTTVVYGTAGPGGRDLTLHLHAGVTGERRAGIVLVHGGGWVGGSPAMLLPIAARLAGEGFVVATVGYRLVPEAPWPAALDDVRQALRWVRAQAADIGLDPERLAIGGGSAGGQMAALVALTPDDEVGAAVLYNPVVDVRPAPFARILADGGDPALLAAASPITHVTASAPPILTLVGNRDEITPPATCATFHDALDAAGAPNELVIVPGAGHGLPVDDPAGCAAATARFLREHLLP